MDDIARTKTGPTLSRWQTAMREKPFDRIRQRPLIETRAEHFLEMLETGSVSTNIYLRRLHNFALDMNWLPLPIVVRKHWPKIRFKAKRGITLEEHKKVLAGESNDEWRAYYQMLWYTGGAQTDIATLRAEDVDWHTKVLSFNRMKTGTVVQLHLGQEAEQLLSGLPKEGYLFPHIAEMKESDRAKAFIRRLRLVGVMGVSLHSYRYSWAERAKAAGYPERFAQEALGHASKAIHRAYARHALVKIPSLEDYEKRLKEKADPSP
jgi:integrase